MVLLIAFIFSGRFSRTVTMLASRSHLDAGHRSPVRSATVLLSVYTVSDGNVVASRFSHVEDRVLVAR